MKSTYIDFKENRPRLALILRLNGHSWDMAVNLSINANLGRYKDIT